MPLRVRLQQVLRHRRHQRARQHVGREHREHDRLGHRHEEVARDAGQEEHRHEDDADADRRDERRDRDLLRAVEDGRLERLALLQVPVDVLDRHRRVVHQDADRERQAAERHDVDRLAERAEDDDRVRIDSGIETAMMTVLRQLPRNTRIISAVRHGGDHRLADHALDRGADEQRLVGELPDLELRRQPGRDAVAAPA